MKSTCYLCDEQVETEELEIGQYPICDECVKRMENEDKLNPTVNTEAELMEIIRNYGIDNQKLEEKLAIAVDALTHIKFNGLFKKAGPHGDYAPYDVVTQTELAKKALAEIEREEE